MQEGAGGGGGGNSVSSGNEVSARVRLHNQTVNVKLALCAPICMSWYQPAPCTPAVLVSNTLPQAAQCFRIFLVFRFCARYRGGSGATVVPCGLWLHCHARLHKLHGVL